MATIVLADDGIEFDGRTLESKPLGGVESAVVYLTRELAARGHRVLVFNKCRAPMSVDGVEWAPIGDGLPEAADLYIANRGDRLIPLVPGAGKRLFWTHNPARYMVKWRYIAKLWRWRPHIVFIGAYHARTLPAWLPDGGRAVIPYGIADDFRGAGPRIEAPPPRAIFTSNPLRGLDWLLDRWTADIQPRVAGAELHIFSGAATYGAAGDAKADAMNRVLARAGALADKGVVLRGPVPKAKLIEELGLARVMLYRGDVNETFCLAVGEAQALGVPAVVCDLGSMAERVADGETGFVANGEAAFGRAARQLLGDDALWRHQHLAALESQGRWGWAQAAEAFEDLMKAGEASGEN